MNTFRHLALYLTFSTKFCLVFNDILLKLLEYLPKMKTSTSQFLTMLDCMERNGDLNRPAEGPYSRFNQYEKWTELVKVLNMDITGEGKPMEKWKKVWSDFKNNTKRKASKIQKAAAGGGSTNKLVLSDLEIRVLNVIGSQVPTGMIEVEADSKSAGAVCSTPYETKPNVHMIHIEEMPGMHDSMEDPLSPVGCSETASPRADQGNRSPSSRYRRVFRRRSASRRSGPRSSSVDAATRHFRASDERWRNLFSELATEHLRLREREIEQQAQWQALFSRCLDCVESFLK